MKNLFLIMMCFFLSILSLKGWHMQIQVSIDTLPNLIDTNFIDAPIIANDYIVLYPSPIENHLLIRQKKRRKMHIRLLNIGGQVLREQWTKALETDLYVKNLKGLFIVEIQYEGGVYSTTVLIE